MSDSTSNRAVWQEMKTKLRSMPGVAAVFIGEPKSAMQSGTIAIIPQGGLINETNLQGAHEHHRVTIRRFENAMQTPEEEIEFRLDQWRANIESDIMGDFELGGTIAYPLPMQFTWQYGYATVENTLYRMLDVELVYQVFDRATFDSGRTVA